LFTTAADISLFNACKSGNRQAQAKLYNQYCNAMYSICKRMVASEAEAEDVLQNSFVDIFTKLNQFKFESTPGAWIKRIVVNNCINHLRKNRISVVEIDDKINFLSDELKDDVEINLDIIINAIKALPEGYKIIFSLYAIEGYDHAEIAEILNISESTSKSQYSRAKVKLYNYLKESGRMNDIFNH
jgi:RNA polymerase sigma factor (sigma-70 family)